MKNVIKGGKRGLIEGKGIRGKLRSMAADVAGGAVLTGAVPLIRNRADQHAEVAKVRQYLSERGEPVE